jgi:hypothetical protein
MGRVFAVMACVALAPVLTSAAKADPVMGSLTLTVAQTNALGSGGIAQGPVVYSSGSVDLSQVLQREVPPGEAIGASLTGPHLLPNFGGLGENFNTTFQLKIAFDGTSGSQPTINVTGVITGGAMGTPEGTYNTGAIIGASGTPQSANVQGWNMSSGVPMSLINQFLNPSNYYLVQRDSYLYGSPQDSPATASFLLLPYISVVTPVPEPATAAVFLAAIAALCFRHRAGLWRSRRRG